MLDTTLSFLGPRDIAYTTIGLALLVLTLRPALANHPLANFPLFYVLVGVSLAAMGIPVINPLNEGLSAKIVEHGSELIVIISLAGAGLAIDTPETWRNWQGTFRLLIIAMPLTILATFLLGFYSVGLSWASAMLLAAALAPTDPVLAREVQVGPPGQEDETPMKVALTAEAGLNDGLAFPFIYLAITTASAGYTGAGFPDFAWSWLAYDFFYRVIAGIGIGYLCGKVLARIILSIDEDLHGGWNSLVIILSSTLTSYGIAESFSAYGFLAVFAAMRACRATSRSTSEEKEEYEKKVHHGADQLESILLTLVLLWFGMFIGAGTLINVSTTETIIAVALVCIVRPFFGFISLVTYSCTRVDRLRVSFFGIRGMGTIFYIAYAQNHATFDQVDVIWRIASVAILLSITIHGFASKFMLEAETNN